MLFIFGDKDFRHIVSWQLKNVCHEFSLRLGIVILTQDPRLLTGRVRELMRGRYGDSLKTICNE